MPTKREWAMLALALPVILLAAAATDPADEDSGIAVAEVARTDRKHADAPRMAPVADLDLTQLRREVAAAEPADAFQTKSWYVPPPPPPPPPPPKPLPPPVPTAPPLPFTYLGKFQDAAQPVIFLVRGDRILTVSAGDVIEGTYRVDGIVGATLGLTYLPLNIKQQINIGNAG
jgi:hypothetical protein